MTMESDILREINFEDLVTTFATINKSTKSLIALTVQQD
jgi:hypothetical protein